MNKTEKLISVLLGLVLCWWVWHSITTQKKAAEEYAKYQAATQAAAKRDAQSKPSAPAATEPAKVDAKTKPAEEAAHLVLDILSERNIPYAVALGNHDSDFDLSREQMNELMCGLKGCVNTAADNILTLSGECGPDRVFYLFDSGDRETVAGVNGWGYIHAPQIEWYRCASDSFKEKNGGKPVPALAFFHIPLPEYNQALRDPSRFLCGNVGEEPCSPTFNSGLYLAMREQGDVQAVCTGHDHNNDFVLYWQGFFFIYGRYSCFDNIYNDLQPSGIRVFEFTLGDPGFRTWIRLADGRRIQELYLYPGLKRLGSE